MHFIDRLAPLGFRLDRRTRVFARGWGDAERLSLFDRGLTAADPVPTLDLEWSRKEEHDGFRLRRASLTSPIAELVPDQARVMSIEWIEPSRGARRTVVLLPAWNDEGFDVRRRLAKDLAQRGVAALIADIPYYGPRRVSADDQPAIGTVSEFVTMGYAAVAEGRALVAVASHMGTPGVAGYSMGGNLAAAVSASLVRPVATAPLAGSHGPSPVYLEGMLRRAIDWKALGGVEVAEGRMRELFDKASVLRLPPMAHHPAAIVVSAGKDGFVPTSACRALAAHWGAELRTVEGEGHGSLQWRFRHLLVDAVVDSFERLERS